MSGNLSRPIEFRTLNQGHSSERGSCPAHPGVAMKIPWLTLLLIGALASAVQAQTFDSFLGSVVAAPDSERAAMVDSFMAATPIFPLRERDTLCHFLYRGAASTITVPGDANGWDGAAFPMTPLFTTNLWYRTVTFPVDARLDYKFVLNGNTWILDPRNPYQVSGGFGPNSELRMPAYVPPPEIDYNPSIPHGTMHDTTFFSAALNNSRTVRIYTPPSYASSTDSFPVVLFHDGLEYVTLANANTILDNLIAQGRIVPIIGVFVPPVNRTPEYAGAQMTQFTDFLVNTVMPVIDGRYRTRHEPEARAVMGASNGGNISLWMGYTHPEAFGNIAAQSSNIISSTSSGFQSSPRLDLRLYLDLGTYDIAQLIPLVRNFIPILQSKGYPYRYEEYHEGHSWGNWRAHIDNALEMFFPGPALGVNEGELSLPRSYLAQNYPNPFNGNTTIRFKVDGPGIGAQASLRVYDILGQEVETLVDGPLSPGDHSAFFDAGGLPSGVYFYRFTTGTTSRTGRMMLLR
jgi:enterochelin esterase-like enzyme